MREQTRDRGDRDMRGDNEGLANGGRRPRRRGCTYCSDDAVPVDYKDPQGLRYFVTERGKIVPRRISGVCTPHQRRLAESIKQARNIALVPFASPV